MKKFGTLFLLLTLLACGCRQREAQAAELQPLTVEEWKRLPAEEKFEWVTLERLKLGDPRFQDDGQWDRFARTVLVPARRRELPDKK